MHQWQTRKIAKDATNSRRTGQQEGEDEEEEDTQTLHMKEQFYKKALLEARREMDKEAPHKIYT